MNVKLKVFKQLSTYLLHILLPTIVVTCFLWTDIYAKKYLRITVIRPIGVTPLHPASCIMHHATSKQGRRLKFGMLTVLN